MQLVGHVVGLEFAQVVDEVFLDGQITDPFIATFDDAAVRRQADGDHTDLMILAVHDVDDQTQHFAILEQFLRRQSALTRPEFRIEDVFVANQKTQTFVDVRRYTL